MAGDDFHCVVAASCLDEMMLERLLRLSHPRALFFIVSFQEHDLTVLRLCGDVVEKALELLV